MTALAEQVARHLVHAFMDGAERLGESPEGSVYVLAELPPCLLAELEQFEADTVDDEEDDPPEDGDVSEDDDPAGGAVEDEGEPPDEVGGWAGGST